jgi:hypothetical protein
MSQLDMFKSCRYKKFVAGELQISYIEGKFNTIRCWITFRQERYDQLDRNAEVRLLIPSRVTLATQPDMI